MATISRTYDFTGADLLVLNKFVQAELTVVNRCTGSVRLVVTYDDSADGALASVDEQMEILGFYPASADETRLLMQSPDGTTYIVSITNGGTLSIVEV